MADTLACRKGDTASTNPTADPVVARLVIISIVAAAGDFTRFADADKLVDYVGLNPRMRILAGTEPRCYPIEQGLYCWSDLLAESACTNSSELVVVVGTRQSDDRQPFGLQ